MAFSINQFRSQMTGDGARPNLFECSMPFPGFSAPGDAQQKLTFMCRAAQLPGSTIGVVPVQYFGRELKFAGNRTFADWSVTIMNDENHTLRNAFNAWVNYVSTSDYESTSKSLATDYYSTVKIKHLKADGSISRQYQLTDAYPTDVGALDLSFDSTDTLSEFTVNFQYHYLQAGNKDEAFAPTADMTT